MNKSLLTNALAAMCVVAGVVSPVGQNLFLQTGLFALSGAITNWLAIYMLFEKVPLLYGSGVIPSRFEDFKSGIHHLIMGQFFTEENVSRLLAAGAPAAAEFDATAIKNAIPYDSVFDRICDVVLSSKFGGAIAMFGGKNALAGLREPTESVLREVVDDVVQSEGFKAALASGLSGHDVAASIVTKVDRIVAARLEELTPQDVKRIVQDMIHKHLGWLVVWGGVFGGLIGLAVALLKL